MNVWAKLFPFLLVMMSLTGAFYPAIDLCAGEKERGTMETLLISPASRGRDRPGQVLHGGAGEHDDGPAEHRQHGSDRGPAGAAGRRDGGRPGLERLAAALAPPSLTAAFWMVLLLIPLAAFFSAVCLALAVLARSMKEGQYYMTPLYLVCLPLIFLTLAPGIELNLFYSLVPVTGVSLLLRALILGDYDVAWRFFLPVLVPTVVYGAVALRWAIDQFQREDVLFREAERFDLRIWVRHLLRDKEPTPNGGEALFCFALMLTLGVVPDAVPGRQRAWPTRPAAMAAGQVAFILTPPAGDGRPADLVAPADPPALLARGRGTWPWRVALALALNPLVNELRPIVEWLFPISQAIKEALGQMMEHVPSLGVALLLFALVPAVCEELAFRGFILTGLEHGHRTRSAILLSALLFGFLHVLLSLFQQLFNATLLGLVLGLLAVRSRSILPGIVFHFLNNGLAVADGHRGRPTRRAVGSRPGSTATRPRGFIIGGGSSLGALVSALLLAWLWRSGGPSPPRRGDTAEPLAVSSLTVAQPDVDGRPAHSRQDDRSMRPSR